MDPGYDVGMAPIAQFFRWSRVVELVPYGEDDGPHLDLLEPVLRIQIDCFGGADLLAFATGFAVGTPLDDVRIRRGTNRRLVGCFACHQSGLVFAGEINRADLRAFIAVYAQIDVYITRAMVHLDGELSGQPFGAHNGAIGHDLDVGVHAVIEEKRGDRRPGAAIAVIGSTAAKYTIVRWKHETQLGYDSADARC